MTSIILVEFRPGLLEIRRELLESLGHPILSALGLSAARGIDLSTVFPGVFIIGHRAPRNERRSLIAYFRQAASSVPILVLLSRTDDNFYEADYNCPADDPPQWIRAVSLALGGIQ